MFEWLTQMAIVFDRRHDPLWGWLTVFASDWGNAAFCIMLPAVTMSLRRARNRASDLITWIFCGALATHFALLPIAAFTRVWQLRLMTDITVLALFGVCLNRSLSMVRERKRDRP